jgi:hypothetical protein
MNATELAKPAKPNNRKGFKPLYGKAMRRVVISMDDDSIEFLNYLGANNVSQGARRAAEILKESMGWKQSSRREAA